LPIVFYTTRGVKNVKILIISKWSMQQYLIPSSNLGHSEVGAWILFGKFLLHRQRVIASCWLLQIISQSGPKLIP
jgi:hypothetical protein